MRQYRRMPLALGLVLLVATAACRGDRANDTVGTAGTPIRVTDVTIGRAIGGDKAVTDRTDTF